MGNLTKETPVSEMVATLEVLEQYGVTRETLTSLRAQDKRLAMLTANFMLNGGKSNFVSQRLASLIMGKNFLGPNLMEKNVGRTGVFLREKSPLEHVPFSEETLFKFRDSHILMADPGYAISYLVKHCLSLVDAETISQDMFEKPFAAYSEYPYWRLVTKYPSFCDERDSSHPFYIPTARTVFCMLLVGRRESLLDRSDGPGRRELGLCIGQNPEPKYLKMGIFGGKLFFSRISTNDSGLLENGLYAYQEEKVDILF